MKPAGLEAAQGIISSTYIKDPTDPQWKNDPGLKAWNEFLDKYYPEANRADGAVMYAYTVAQTLVHVLQACGENLTRENVMKQAASSGISNSAASCPASRSTPLPPTLPLSRRCT